MSWLDLIKDDIVITTGNGNSYSPNWVNAKKDLEWNITEFSFPGQAGSLVNRKKKIGTKYNLELYFQGEDHLDNSKSFESALNADENPIKIQHPYYGVIYVQAHKFNIDNSGHNISKWTGTVIETILDINPKIDNDIVDEINVKKETLDELAAQAIIATPSQTDVSNLSNKTDGIFNKTVPILEIPEEIETYFNLYSTASSAANNLIASPLIAMQTAIAMINAPSLYAISLKNKLNLLSDYFNQLSVNYTGFTDSSSKQIYFTMSAAVISSFAISANNPQEGDYNTSKDVYDTIDTLVTQYDTLVMNLNNLQTTNGGSPSSYIPDQSILFYLNNIINLTVSNLFSLALNSRSEYSFFVEEDTNYILLAHRLYGLSVDDSTITELMEQNNLGLNGILQIRKGTTITYYK